MACAYTGANRLDRRCMSGGMECMNDVSDASTVLARVATDGKTAGRLADGLAEALDPGTTAVAAFETRDGSWTVEIYFEHAPDGSHAPLPPLDELLLHAGTTRMPTVARTSAGAVMSKMVRRMGSPHTST